MPGPPVPAVVVPLADHGLLVEHVDAPDLARRFRRLALPGVEAVATTASLVLSVDPDLADPAAVADRLHAMIGAARPAAAGSPRPVPAAPVDIPVRFDGPDLGEVAEALGSTVGEVTGLLVGARLSVAFLGFAPGFAYLTGLPDALAGLPRRPSPRPRVPPGSVAVAGGYAAVYPQASPGGWNLLGTSDLPLFDRHHPPYALLQPGQAVRFVAEHRSAAPGRRDRRGAGPSAAGTGAGRTGPAAAGTTDTGTTHTGTGAAGTGTARARRVPAGAGGPTVTVEAPGLSTTVQDGGRRGVAHLGVPGAGAADRFALRLANRLVGNADDAPGLEVTVAGPRLRVDARTFVAVVGDVPVTLDGRPVAVGAPVPVAPGQVLHVGACRAGARAVVALAGGVLGPEEVGSRSSDQLCGLGPGPLRAGDVLAVGDPAAPAGHLSAARLAHGPLAAWAGLVGLGRAPDRDAPVTLAVVPGPDGDPADADRLAAVEWVVQPTSDRVGVRLAPAGAARAAPAALPVLPPLPGSRGSVTGMVQLPPGGEPVVLLCDHASVGGYPVAATVAAVDIALVAQCRPCARLRFAVTDPATARRRWDEAVAHLRAVVAGRYPTGTGT